jgi:hypothetical protein
MRSFPRAEHPDADDTARFAAMTPAERIALCLELCDLADSIVDGRPDPQQLRNPHPRSAESLELWRRLMQAY